MTKAVQIFSVEPLYKRANGLYVQEIDRVDLPLGFEPNVRHLVTVPSGVVSANHTHPRKEAFIGIGETLEFTWVDEKGAQRTELMNSDGKLKLFVVDSNVPHAIRNNSASLAVLLEYADRPQTDSEVTEYTLV